MGSSQTFCIRSAEAALQAADEFLGLGRVWHGDPANQDQRAFLKSYLSSTEDGRRLDSLEGIDQHASWEHTVLNDILEKRGFNLRFNPFGDGEFGTVGIFEKQREWACRTGSTVSIPLISRASVPGVELDGHFEVRSCVGMPCAVVHTTRGERVYMIRNDRNYTPMDLHRVALEVVELTDTGSRVSYQKLLFPKVDLNQQPDVSFIECIVTVSDDDDHWRVKKVEQQNILQVDTLGFLAKSATTMGFECLSVRPPQSKLIMDGPFLFIVVGDLGPEFVAHVHEDAMKDPQRT